MKNPKTSISGYCLIAIAVLQLVYHFASGGGLDVTDHLKDVVTALAGAGLVMSKDGGH